MELNRHRNIRTFNANALYHYQALQIYLLIILLLNI